ncbi:hypothetical protein LXA47_32540 [Massilia sp. P8910]|uniref:hypothetical protein n=1 Tax=Massilia antarctica TaxID=2765360 RepID=UPI001E37D644|nr:hypothetical protein [Massilia antarctica]MCE3608298.1 hypothetical protein [Massilia antarctica]
MKKFTFAFLIFTQFSMGCSPLQQAPLVYSSKVSVGLDISATSTETPGAGVTIGYKQVDAAYVPVAVSKKCEPLNDEKCSGETFKLISLNGNNRQEDGTTPTEAELSSASAASAKATEDQNKKQDAIAPANEKYEATKKLADASDALVRKVNDLKKDDPKGELAKATTDLEAANIAKGNLQKDAENLAAAKSARDAAALEAKKAADVYQNKLAASKSKNQNAKSDAYSVFGTFNSDAASSIGVKQEITAGLKLGKLFSTGVASQNLTEGMKLYYATMAPGACLDKVVRVIEYFPADERAALAKKLVAACASSSPQG